MLSSLYNRCKLIIFVIIITIKKLLGCETAIDFLSLFDLVWCRKYQKFTLCSNPTGSVKLYNFFGEILADGGHNRFFYCKDVSLPNITISVVLGVILS